MIDTVDIEQTRTRLSEMRLEHRDMDTIISTLSAQPSLDQLQIRRLKKRKLQLKEHIERLESRLIPNLDA